MAPTPETHIFIGMFRPPWEELHEQCCGCLVDCSCGIRIQSTDSVRDHWQRGHFDSPQYATREEIIERIARSTGTTP